MYIYIYIYTYIHIYIVHIAPEAICRAQRGNSAQVKKDGAVPVARAHQIGDRN